MVFSYPPLSKLPLCFTHANSFSSNCTLVLFTGPKLPMRLDRHAMVQLGNGLAIIGGHGAGYGPQDKVHLLICINRNCSISILSQELSAPREWFLAIPIPDTIAGCISGGKRCKKRCLIFFLFQGPLRK